MNADVRRILHHFQKVELAFFLEFGLERRRRIKVVLDGALAMAADDENFLNAALQGFLNDVLNGRFVDNWQHFLRCCLRRGQKARAVACCWNDCFSDFLHNKFP